MALCRTIHTQTALRLPLTNHRIRQFSTILTDSQRVAETKTWFERVVIGEKLCPFALPFWKQPELLRIISTSDSSGVEKEKLVEIVAEEVRQLLKVESNVTIHETTLVIVDHPFLQDFRDFVRFSWDLQEDAIGTGHVNQLHIVLFHPKATHQTYGTEEEDEAANYTIRSPYPTIHLLRQVDILTAVQGGYPNLDTLHQRNAAKMALQGLEMCQSKLKSCFIASTNQGTAVGKA